MSVQVSNYARTRKLSVHVWTAVLPYPHQKCWEVQQESWQHDSYQHCAVGRGGQIQLLPLNRPNTFFNDCRKRMLALYFSIVNYITFFTGAGLNGHLIILSSVKDFMTRTQINIQIYITCFSKSKMLALAVGITNYSLYIPNIGIIAVTASFYDCVEN